MLIYEGMILLGPWAPMKGKASSMCSAFTDSELFFADYLLLGFIFCFTSLGASVPNLM